jgi:DNA-binding CsgD family transcriptional regulator
MFAPSLAVSDAQRELAGTFERASASPAMARTLLEALIRTDVRELLPRVSVPTLVMHREGDLIPVDEARYVARRIPGARYLPLRGADHLPWTGDSDAVVSATEGFLQQARISLPADEPAHAQARARNKVTDPAADGGSAWQQLTSAEQVVSMLVAEGLSNPAIASRLFISRHTVEAHLKHIFLRLGIGSRVELARIAFCEGAKIPELRDAD